eukprot:SAG31_NODE_1019_length_10354_cov_9.730180_11_plen_81_part_00
MSQKTKKKAEYTEKEYAEMRSKMVSYYEKEIPFLELQFKFESLVADIEDAKTRKIMALAQAAQIYTAMNPEEEQKLKADG